MKSIVLFNNKGGVGKTTLTANVASYFAKKKGMKVVVIDCDPQCNVSQLILGDDKTIDLYWSRSKRLSVNESTLIDLIQPVLDGDAAIDSRIEPGVASNNRFGVSLLPGHPRFSTIEDPLSRAWGDLTATKVGGFRITHWLTTYLAAIDSKFDYAFIDVGPSLGSINRSVLAAADYFVTPLGSDIFSLLGIRNIAQWMATWIEDYKRAVDNLKPGEDEALTRYSIPRNLSISNGYVGYTLQQYITKAKRGVRRPTLAFEQIIANVPDEIHSYLSDYFAKQIDIDASHLGDVPNLYSIIPLAQSVNAPIFELKSGDGLVGAQYQQAERYGELIQAVSERILENTQ